MKILLVEDDENKRQQIAQVIREARPAASLHEARSLHSGLAAVKAGDWDLVVLDMSIPAFDISADEHGGGPQALGGRELLAHMRRLRVRTPVVVVTQFDEFGTGPSLMTLEELNRQLAAEHGETYLSAIVFNVVYDEWQSLLRDVIEKVGSEGGR